MEGPGLKCTVAQEKGNPANAALQNKEVFKAAELSLARNEFKEVILVLEAKGKTFKYKLQQDQLRIHRKFVKEGKLTLNVSDRGVTLLISNAPPHSLVQFVKLLASKLAGTAKAPKMTGRQKLLSALPSTMEGISPVTQKDVQNLREAEKGKEGLLKLNLGSPTGRPGKALKRSRQSIENEKENTNVRKSPRLQAVRKPSLSGRVTDLTAEQRYVLEAVKSGQNVFFTGGAGVGKSFLISKIIGNLPPNATFVTASTGVAAYQIGGITLHSFAGIGSGQLSTVQSVEKAMNCKTVSDTWKKCKHLIIDEISMVDGRFFRKLEAVARGVRGNELPFGGIQLILAGDFLQLPPVSKGKDRRVFCFETSAWRRCVQHNVELTIVKRQTDEEFVQILKNLRNGICSEKHEEILKSTRSNSIGGDGLVATKLCSHTQDVKNINRTELANLKGPLKTFASNDSDPALSEYMDAASPVGSKVNLRIGAQVMLMKNLDVGRGLVNGARGYVAAFERVTGWPVVHFASGRKVEVKPEKWSVKTAGGMILTRKQLPLQLAWAFSIHKSQGMTLDCVEMSLSRVFESGQAYVALSRAKNLQSVKILDFSKACIKADPKVLKFYKNLRYESPMVQTTLHFG